jgi:hypothetical protein
MTNQSVNETRGRGPGGSRPKSDRGEFPVPGRLFSEFPGLRN